MCPLISSPTLDVHAVSVTNWLLLQESSLKSQLICFPALCGFSLSSFVDLCSFILHHEAAGLIQLLCGLTLTGPVSFAGLVCRSLPLWLTACLRCNNKMSGIIWDSSVCIASSPFTWKVDNALRDDHKPFFLTNGWVGGREGNYQTLGNMPGNILGNSYCKTEV